VHDADDQRPNDLIDSETTEDAIHPADGRGVLGMTVFFRAVAVRMTVNVVTVAVRVRVKRAVRRRECFGDPAHHSGEIQNSQKNQHQADGEFHGKADSCGDDNSEKDDGGADDEDRDGVAKAPEGADYGGVADAALAAHDGGHRDYVIGVGGMAHAEEEAKSDNGEECDHLLETAATREVARRRSSSRLYPINRSACGFPLAPWEAAEFEECIESRDSSSRVSRRQLVQSHRAANRFDELLGVVSNPVFEDKFHIFDVFDLLAGISLDHNEVGHLPCF